MSIKGNMSNHENINSHYFKPFELTKVSLQ